MDFAEKDQAFNNLLKFCTWLQTMDYGNLWDSSMAEDEKGLDWITLSRNCLKSGCPSANMILYMCEWYLEDCA